jgi:hypothetical protein
MKCDDVLSTTNPAWTEDAKALMRSRKHFAVVGWKKEFDEKESQFLIEAFGYTYWMQPEADRAFFQPPDSN